MKKFMKYVKLIYLNDIGQYQYTKNEHPTHLFNIGPDSPGNKTSIGGATLLKSKCTTTDDGNDSIPSCDAKQLV